MEIIFPDNYPIDPPFIRVVNPRFKWKTGHITSGGSICMEILTRSGWSAACSLESLIVDIKCSVIEGGGQIDLNKWNTEYTLAEAKESFNRIAASYGWTT